MADISRVLGEGCGPAKVTCKLEEPLGEPMVPYTEWRKQVIAKWLGALYLIAMFAAVAWIMHGTIKKTPKVTINTVPVSFEFDYKCRLCGADNHIKEVAE